MRGLESLAGEYPDRTGGKYIPSGWTGKHPKGEFGGLCSHAHISLDNYWVATPCLCFQPHLYRLFTNTHLKCVLCCFFCFLTFIQTASECITSLGTGVRENCEPSCRCWKLNLGPLKEQPVFFTSEPFTRPVFAAFCGVNIPAMTSFRQVMQCL